MKRRLLFAILTPFIVAAVVLAQEDSIARGVEAFRRGDYRAALQEFQRARPSHASDAVLENLIGITETKLGQTEAANRDYRRAIMLNPKLPDPRKNLAFNLLEAGQFSEALDQLKSAVALDSSDAVIRYYFVLAGLGLHRDAEVVSNIGAAEPLLAGDPENAVLAVQSCLRAGDDAHARELTNLLENGAALSASQEEGLARAFNDREMYPDAAARYRRLLQMRPGSWETQYDLAVTLARAQQTAEASSLLASLADQHAGEPAILEKVASTAEFAGNSALAVRALRRVIALDPKDPNPYLDCTRLLMDLDRYDDAAAVVQAGLAQVPDPYPLTIRLGAIEMMRGNTDAAENHYRTAIRQHPEIALGYVALAQLYIKGGNDQAALHTLQEGRTQVQPDFALEYVLGLELSKTGHSQEAMAALATAIRLNDQVVEPHYRLGLIYLRAGNLQEAQQEFEKVLQLNPSYAPSYFQLSRIYARQGNQQRAQQMASKSHELTQAQQQSAMKDEKTRTESFAAH